MSVSVCLSFRVRVRVFVCARSYLQNCMSDLHQIFTARCYASALLAMGLCLCLSVTSRSSTKTAKRRIKRLVTLCEFIGAI